jgi:hypothetical protein
LRSEGGKMTSEGRFQKRRAEQREAGEGSF